MNRRRVLPLLFVLFLFLLRVPVKAAGSAVKLVTLDPGHFHAALVQKFMYDGVSPIVHVYAPKGPDLDAHLARITGFNARPDNPTRWDEEVYTGPDFLERMLSDRSGNVVVLAGNNRRKTESIEKAVQAGFHVLSDKPMAINIEGFRGLLRAFDLAKKNGVMLLDIMTERHEATSAVERALAGMPEVFGTLEQGTPEHPAVEMTSVHHLFKQVAGKPLRRPGWYFDVRQQGEAVPDVGVHLVDLVQWECFPDKALDWRTDVKVSAAKRWPTVLTLEQFQRVTGLADYPEFLRTDVAPDGQFPFFVNGDVEYKIRGIYAKVTALWNYEAPPGAGDTHHSMLRGTRATLTIEQGPEQNHKPTLYVQNIGSSAADFEGALRHAVGRLGGVWQGLDVQPQGERWRIVIPERYAVGHEAHFAQVTADFLRYLAQGSMSAWEVPNMIAKYFTTAQAFQLSRPPQ